MTPPAPPDQAMRDAAICERERNVVIDAGAGTGKTTTLVRRLVELVAPEDGGRALDIERLAAVTFTRRAAGELKLRVREELLRTLASSELSDARRSRLQAALGGLDTAMIGTIHGFADRLLRMRLVEARLSPSYEILDDDEEISGETFRTLLTAVQQGTLAAELAGTDAAGRHAEAADAVRDCLRAGLRAETQEIELGGGATFERCGLDALVTGFIRRRDVTPRVQSVLAPDLGRLRASFHEFLELARRVEDDSRFARWLREMAGRIERVRTESDPVVLFAEIATPVLRRRSGSRRPTKSGDCGGNADVWRIWKILDEGAPHRDVGPAPLGDDMVEPLAQWLARRLVGLEPVVLALYEKIKAQRGVVDQIDLLLRLRNLLRDNRRCRAFYQGLFDHILIDEFQDTDPLQAEIVLFLCETSPVAETWEEVDLIDGRLTLVGDPKQSIYRFRRADVAMYEAIRTKAGKRALCVELKTNFRMAPSLISHVNDKFRVVLGEDPKGRSFDPQTGRVFHRDLAAGRDAVPWSTLRVLPLDPRENAQGEPTTAEAWRRREAVLVPQFLRWLITASGQQVVDPVDGRLRAVRYGDVCVLTIATTQLPTLFRELDAAGVPYASSGGSMFLEDPLHQKFALGLRAVADPGDGVAEAALFRPPFFAVDLADIAKWKTQPGLQQDMEDPSARRVRAIAQEVARLRQLSRSRSPGETARAVLEETGFGRWVALGANGSQRLERLRELCHLVGDLAAAEALDFDGATRALMERIERRARIDTAAPVDDGVVRCLTVHQAKGLEFPVVVIWDTQAGLRGRVSRPAWAVSRDGRGWGLALDGLRCSDPAKVDLAQQEQRYLDEERRRLVYVACTRARDLLVIPKAGEQMADRFVCAVLLPEAETEVDRDAEVAWAEGQPDDSPKPTRQDPEHEAQVREEWQTALEEASRPVWRPSSVTDSLSQPAPPVDDTAYGGDDGQETARKHGTGRLGPLFGTTVHLAIVFLSRSPDDGVAMAVRRAMQATELVNHEEEAVGDVQRTVATLQHEGLWRTPGSDFRLEYPVAGEGLNGALLVGSIDLVAIDADSITVLDFKTDHPPERGGVKPVRYWRQLQLYVDLLSAAGLTEGRQVRRGLLFTADGVVRWE